MIPKDEWETTIIRCFLLCIKNGMNSVEIEMIVVKEFSKKYKLDFIELLSIIKSMVGEL